MTHATKEEIVALERAYWDGMKAKDGKATARLSGDPSLVTGARGVMTIPRAKMGKMTSESDWQLHDHALEDVEVVTPAPDVAVIGYVARQWVTIDGKQQECKAADSSTWVRSGKDWTCVAHSETMLG
ncbi:MAG: nuclear transport factor 2 family protein [Pseudooceanicola sp.]|nr:nuclear transport factor 2 family protein [Pseudooceanicola sp.]